MNDFSVLVMHERGGPPSALIAALSDIGASVILRTPLEALSETEPATDGYNAVLVSSGIPPAMVGQLSQRLQRGRDAPHVISFTEADFDSLDAHLDNGHDFLVPPFTPRLVHARLTAGHQQGQRDYRDAIAAHAELAGYERELQIGRDIQSGFLPEELPAAEGWDVGIRFRPARTVAGDFYDAFELVDRRRLAFVVADVCDKGVGAALFMALIRSLLRHSAEQSGRQSMFRTDLIAEDAPRAAHGRGMPVAGAVPLWNAVCGTNAYLTANHLRQGYFATIFFGVLDPLTGNLVYINGGHNPPVLLRGGDPAVLLEPTGPAVGVLPDSEFTFGHASVGPGDTLYIHTDGVTEARSARGDFFGEERLFEVLRTPVESGEELLTRVDGAIERHTTGAEQSDDITMMALHRRARGA